MSRLCGSSEVVSELEPNFQEDERPKAWPYWVNCEITCYGKRYIEPMDEKESLYNWRTKRSEWNWSLHPITDTVPPGWCNCLSPLFRSPCPLQGYSPERTVTCTGALWKLGQKTPPLWRASQKIQVATILRWCQFHTFSLLLSNLQLARATLSWQWSHSNNNNGDDKSKETNK